MPQRPRALPARLLPLLLLAAAASLAPAAPGGAAGPGRAPAAPIAAGPIAAASQREPAAVAGVVDGDTLRVRLRDGRLETVRVIGLDTPETKDPRRPVQCFGREASARAAALLAGREVRLEADPAAGDRDRYGRLLRHVFLSDGRSFAEVMIAGGFAHEYTYRLPYRDQRAFQAAERSARTGGRGLWAADTCNGDTARPARLASATGDASPCRSGQIKGNRRSGVYHVPDGDAYARTRADVACFDTETGAAAAGFRRARR